MGEEPMMTERGFPFDSRYLLLDVRGKLGREIISKTGGVLHIGQD